MECRVGCAACCIVPSISSLNKEAGVKCPHLTEDLRCGIFGSELRPKVCGGFKPEKLVCGESREDAFEILADLEGLDDWKSLL